MATKVITGKVRASFVHIFEPQSVNGSEPKYSCSFIIPKSDAETIGKIQTAIEEAKQNGVSKWGGKIPPNLKMPLRDGDIDRPDDENYQEHFFLNATSKDAPQVFDLVAAEVFHECKKKQSADQQPTTVAEENTEEQPVNPRKGYYPDDIAGTFGMPVEQHRQESELRQMDGFVSVGMLTGMPGQQQNL